MRATGSSNCRKRTINTKNIMASILIVDDERAIRNSMKEILEYESYKVDVAENGVEA